MQIKSGATRHVLLIGCWAVKVPRVTSWRNFLQGLLANMQEREFARTGWPELCPVLWAVPGGWVLVMARAQPLTAAEWSDFRPDDFCAARDYAVPVESKHCSFGTLAGRIVAVDYGS